MVPVREGISLRTALPGDHQWMVRCVDDWFGRSVSHALPRLFLDHFHRSSRVAEHDGQPIGFLVGFPSPSEPETAYLHFVGVHPDWRGMGVARRLYEAFFDIARRASCSQVKSITAPSNEGSIAFHRRMGFQASRPVKDYDRPGTDRIVFLRPLPQEEPMA